MPTEKKKKKNEEEEEEEQKEEKEGEEDMRKMTYLHGGALVESFSPQGRRAPLLFFMRLCEGPRPGPGRAPWLCFACTCA